MKLMSGLRFGAAGLALFLVSASAVAQEVVPRPTPTADALAEQVRIVSASPRNVSALVTAGELAAKLGDMNAAAGFFGRAEAIEPNNPRLAAGKASMLVMMERPGEALRLFGQAESAGISMTPYLAQRGLAYDLVGQTGYAQRDYRRALLTQPDDETTRRLALSLGISGRRDEALTLLDPLLRKSDRAAWRARACILAIGGDMAGAARIAASMIPGGAALGGFFARLQWLSPADRAFAVHFGDLTPSVARSNDARLAPALAALPAEAAPLPPAPSVAVAAANVAPSRRSRRSSEQVTGSGAPVPQSSLTAASMGRNARDRRTERRQTASAPAIVPLAQQATTTAPPVRTQAAVPAASWIADGRPVAAEGAGAAPATMTASTPVITREPVDAPRAAETTPVQSGPFPLAPGAAVAGQQAQMVVINAPVRGRPGQPIRQSEAPSAGPTPAPATQAASAPATPVPEPVATAASPPVQTAPTPAPVEVAAAQPSPLPPAAAPVAAASPAARPPAPVSAARRRANTDLLASIVASISVPAEELEVREAPATKPVARKPAPQRVEPEARPAETKAVAKKPEAKAAAKPDPKSAAEAKKKADAPKPEAPRWWVQVAGGAKADDLDKDWRRLASGSSALKGKAAFTTPLRATNRLLTGPFKTEAEARAVVNALAKEGKSAFTFQSAAGQKVDKLGDK